MLNNEAIFTKVANGVLDPEQAIELLDKLSSSNNGEKNTLNSDDLQAIILNYLQHKLADVLSVSPEAIDCNAEFMDLGLESTALIRIAESVEQELNIELYPTLFFEYKTLNCLANHFADVYPKKIMSYAGINSDKEETDTRHQDTPPPVKTPQSTADIQQELQVEKKEEETLTTSQEDLTDRALAYFSQKLASVLNVDENELDIDENLMDLGIDSTALIQLVDIIETELDVELYPTLFFEYTTLKQVAGHLANEHPNSFIHLKEEKNRKLSNPLIEPDGTQINSLVSKESIEQSTVDFSNNIHLFSHHFIPLDFSFDKKYQPTNLVIFSPTPSLKSQYQPSLEQQQISHSIFESEYKTGHHYLPCITDTSVQSVLNQANDDARNFIYLINANKVGRHGVKSLIDASIADFMLLNQQLKSQSHIQLIIYIKGNNAVSQVLASAFSSFLKSLKREITNTNFAIVIDHGIGTELGQRLLDALQIVATEREKVLVLKLNTEQYFIQAVYRTDRIPKLSKESPVRKHGAYLITGASGKLGMLIAEYLARVHKANLMLTGRRKPNKAIEQLLQTCRSYGAQAYYEECDIVDRQQTSDTIDIMRRRFKVIDGIFHIAGLVDDNVLSDKKLHEFKRVTAPKIQGVLNLDEITRKDPLDLFVCFSSIAAFTGNRGQTDYAMANGFMDGMMAYRKELKNQGFRSGKSLSINWPLWRDGGMHPDPIVKDIMHTRLGLESLENGDAFKALEWSLLQDLHQIAVFAGIGEKIENWLFDGDPEKLTIAPKQKEAIHSTVIKSPIQPNPESNIETPLKVRPDEGKSQKDPQPEKTVSTAKSLSNLLDSNNSTDKYAVIGMDGRFPGSMDLQSFMDNISAGVDLINTDPERWKFDDYAKQKGIPLEELSKLEAGFIDDIDKFDAAFFNISPAEAKYMDPQQRLFMQTAWKTIEDAGYDPFSLSGKKVGVFVGASTRDYESRLSSVSGIKTEQDMLPYISTGLASNNIANRFSYFLDLKGPSLVVDTACSSSLVAMHQGLNALRHGEAELCIIGGVNLMLVAGVFSAFKASGLLSDYMRCRSFAKDANGYARGEGVGAVLIKPLQKALEDGDHIYGTILGSAVNHGGKVQSLTAPSPTQQADVIEAALHNAQVDPSNISYIEAHGTGTALGDSVEVRGLNMAFKNASKSRKKAELPEGQCAIGSVKSNIGHLEAAAGIAGLIKTLLCIKHRYLPKLIHLSDVNPFLELKGSPFSLLKTSRAWDSFYDKKGNPLPLCAGVSSFGFGGTNAHIVLEEAPTKLQDEQHESTDTKRKLIPLSAQSMEQLNEYATNLAHWLTRLKAENTPPRLEDIAYTMQTGRPSFKHRLVVQAVSISELCEALNKFVSGEQDYHSEYAQCDLKHSSQSALQGEATDILVEHFSNVGNLKKISRLWLEGLKTNWGKIYKDKSCNRIALPTYPFKRTSYWVDSTQEPNQDNPVNEEKSHQHISVNHCSELPTKTLENQGLSSNPPSVEEISVEAIKTVITQELETLLQLDKEDITPQTSFSEIGLDSIIGMKLVNNLESRFDIKFFIGEVAQFNSIAQLADYIFQEIAKSPHIAASEKPQDPVFILSSPRSGSTLLRVMLEGNNTLFAPPELHLLNFNNLSDREKVLGQSGMTEGLTEAISVLKGINTDKSAAEVRENTEKSLSTKETFGQLMELAHPKILVDKSPLYGLDLATLKKSHEWFPNSRYIFLVRHPKAVVSSLVDNRFDRLFALKTKDSWSASMKAWFTINKNIQQFLSNIPAEKKLLIYFEELLVQPELHMRKVCEFLDIKYSENMVKPYSGKKMIHGLHNNSLSVGDPNFLKHDDIDTTLATRWADKDSKKNLAPNVTNLASELGYDLGPNFMLHKHGNDGKPWQLVQRFIINHTKAFNVETVRGALHKLFRIFPILTSSLLPEKNMLEVNLKATFNVQEILYDDLKQSNLSVEDLIKDNEKDAVKLMQEDKLITLTVIVAKTNDLTSHVSFIFSHYLLDGYGAILLLTKLLKIIAGLPFEGNLPTQSFSRFLQLVDNDNAKTSISKQAWRLPEKLKVKQPNAEIAYAQKECSRSLEINGKIRIKNGLFADVVGAALCRTLKNSLKSEHIIAFRFHGRKLTNHGSFFQAFGNFAVDLPLKLSTKAHKLKSFAKCREKTKTKILSSYDKCRVNADLRLNIQEIQEISIGDMSAQMCAAYEVRKHNHEVNYPLELIVRRYKSHLELISRFNANVVNTQAVDELLCSWLNNIEQIIKKTK